MLPSNECNRNADRSIVDPTELDEVVHHHQYLVQGNNIKLREKISSKTNPLNGVVALLRFHFLLGQSSNPIAERIKRLFENEFGVKHPIILAARHAIVKLFLRHTHIKHHHQGIDYLRSKVQDCYTILKLRSSLRSIKSNCVTCRIFCAAIIQLIMTYLPVERIAYHSPPSPTSRLTTSARLTLLCVGLPRRGGVSSSQA